MLLTISKGKHTFEKEYDSISMEEIKDLTRSFMQIHQVDDCSWSVCGEESLTDLSLAELFSDN